MLTINRLVIHQQIAEEEGAGLKQIRCSIVVSISACHAEDPGSIPGGGVLPFGIHTQVLIPRSRTIEPKPNLQKARPRPNTPKQCRNEVNTSPSFTKFLAAELCIRIKHSARHRWATALSSISGLVVEYIVAIDVTRVRFPADAFSDYAV